jgi:hypothetical protein
MKLKLFLFILLTAGAAVVSSGCGSVASLAGVNENCVVIAKQTQVRSSGAVVAADLLKVTRGNTLEILGEETFDGVKWYNVRAMDENSTEGWVEARDVITQKMLDQSKKLAAENADIPTQATGQLRAATNLRLAPDRNKDDNIMQKLIGGDTFEIIGWQRIRKPENADENDKDDQPKANQQAKPKREREKPEVLRLDDVYDTWYKVRLRPEVSPAPVGWIYGKQVELTVPPDIIFYRTGREFVAWSKLDGEGEGNVAGYAQSMRDRDGGKEGGKPGSWVILEKSSRVEDPNVEEPDFDHIRIIGYDKYNQDHFKVYVSGRVKGFLPLRVTGSGESRTFTVRIKGDDGQIKDYSFSTYKDSRGLLKVNVPPDIPKENKNDR